MSSRPPALIISRWAFRTTAADGQIRLAMFEVPTTLTPVGPHLWLNYCPQKPFNLTITCGNLTVQDEKQRRYV
ncbi:MAG: hypothetical protein ACR2O4_11695, partial [Hyphomicrobiaceae bacterium]